MESLQVESDIQIHYQYPEYGWPILLEEDLKELKKMLDAKIIVPLRISEWIANLLLVRKRMVKLDCVWILGI